MATSNSTESTYFPPLDKCLAGEARLISWRTAYRAICDEDAAIDNSHLEQFFSDNDAITVLSTALDPYQKPSARSAGDLDTKTAPINVSQNQNVDYDLAQIKGDSKWLSRELDIDELSALRIAIVEWQERPADQLLNTAFHGGSALTNAADLAASVLAKSTMDQSASTTATARPVLDFAKEDVRQQRLLDVFMSETSYLRKLSADLVSRSAVSRPDVQGQSTGSFRATLKRSWIDDVAARVMDGMCPQKDNAQSEVFIGRCITNLETALEKSTVHTSWPKIFANDSRAAGYIESIYCEIVSTLRLLTAGLYAFDGIPSTVTVQTWFNLMSKYSYLHEIPSYLSGIDVAVAQLLVSIISVDVLKVQLAVGSIMNAAGVETPTLRRNCYVNDEQCLSSLNNSFQCASKKSMSIAAPAILAWSIITSVIRDIALIHRDVKETRHGSDDELSGSARRASTRRGSRDDSSEFEKLYFMLCSREFEEFRDDPPRYFLMAAVDGMRVFGLLGLLSINVSTTYNSTPESNTAFMCKEILLDLTRDGLPFVQYDGEILEAALTFITPVDSGPMAQHIAAVLADKMLSDLDQFRPVVFDQALSRYPYELSPMLKLCTAFANAENRHRRPAGTLEITEILHNLPNFTHEVPANFRSYQLENEEDNLNAMVLTGPLPIFSAQGFTSWRGSQKLLTSGLDEPEVVLTELDISAGTKGTIIREQRPLVMTLKYPHSGLEYLSVLLSTFAPSSELIPASQRVTLDCYTAAEIIMLFTALLSASLKQENGKVSALELLETFSHALRSDQGIVSVIADILERELVAHLDQVAQDGSLVLVTACAEFLEALAKASPSQVWAILSKSSLLGTEGGASSFISVVTGVEAQINQFKFLKTCVQLHAILLDDAISGVVTRKQKQATAKSGRWEAQPIATDTTPERTMSAVLDAYQKALLDLLQNFPDWKFSSIEERCTITATLLNSFSKLLMSTYGIDVAKEPSQRLTYVLAPAARSLLDTCVPKTGESPLLKTFIRILPEGLPVASDATPVQARKLFIDQTTSVSTFLTILLRTAKSGIDLLAAGVGADINMGGVQTAKEKGKHNAPGKHSPTPKRAYSFAAGVLTSMPVLASLLAGDHAFKADLFALLSELTEAAGSSEDDPPSLLAPLNTEAAKAFLQVVTQLDRPLCDAQVERRIWDFLCVVMNNRQQWFAIYLLTGKLPKSRNHRRHSDPIKGKPILGYALDQLSSIGSLSPERAVGMLKFLVVAQRTWVWATNELRGHQDFLKATLAWLEKLEANPQQPGPGPEIIIARELEMASYLCEILAINLHASLEIGDQTVLRALVPKLGFLRDQATGVKAYNPRLHKRLADNLKLHFPQSELSDFKRTEANPASFGTEFYYDRQIASLVYRHHSAWQGRTPTEGYTDEFYRANANFSLLYAQINLLNSWKMLATTLCECADGDLPLQVELAKAAEQTLLHNVSPLVEEPGVPDVLPLRTELAFVLISRLVALKVQDAAMKRLLPVTCRLVATSPVDYDVATVPDDVRYYRQLLQLMYLSIQPYNYAAKPQAEMQYLDPNIATCLIDIVSRVVVPGFRALCSNLYTDIELALPGDFALLTALLQATVGVPGISSVQTLLSDIVAGSSIIRGALSLYSWADQLMDAASQDPIYGEISVMFLLALSTVRPIAEQMALDGVLTQLSSGNLSNYFRKPGGKGPFEEPQRMFVIWTEGFLPLCLNLLDSVGPAMAAEVATFLNSFPDQLRRAEKSLQNETPSPRNPKGGAVTLSLVSEAHSLSMIALILISDSARGAADGIDAADISALEYDHENVRTLAESLTRSKRSLNDRITPANALEERWWKTRAEGVGDDVLSAKVLRELTSMLACFPDTETP